MLELDVGPVAHGGHCVARYEGRVVFVRHALPGERVRAVVTDGGPTARYWRADAVDVIVASPDRVAVPCPYAHPGGCGGCDWQHAALDAQRRLKASVVAEQLRRLAGIERDVVVEPVPGDKDGLGWRTRVSFAVDAQGRAGLRKHRSHDVVPIDRCLIAHESLHEIGVTARRWTGVEQVEALVSAVGEQAVVVTPSAVEAKLKLPRLDQGVSILVQSGQSAAARVRGRGHVREEAAGRSWRVSAAGFWQVHPGAAQTLVDAVLDFLEPASGESALDLYSGVGLFAGALGDRLGPDGAIVAVESDQRAVTDARRNLHGLESVRLVVGRVDRTLRSLGIDRTDLVVLDPPRTGAGAEVVRGIAALGPRAIAYVACDPAALARDVATFAAEGYELTGLRAFDCFPMTHHVECVALLTPRA